MPDGIFIAVVGPSGAGKDTLLNRAKHLLEDRTDVDFVRRMITRKSDGVTEDHDTLTPEAFESARRDGAFCMTWDAHGLSYGIPASALVAVKNGKTVIANVSRGTIAALLPIFGRAAVIEIAVPKDILARRLAERGRETTTNAQGRLTRSVELSVPPGVAHVRVDNTSPLEVATACFVEAIAAFAPALPR